MMELINNFLIDKFVFVYIYIYVYMYIYICIYIYIFFSKRFYFDYSSQYVKYWPK